MQRKKPGYERKVRYSGQREPRPVVYIAGEGKRNKTEAQYFEGFKSSAYCVQFVQEGCSDPKGIVRKLKNKINDKHGIEFKSGRDRAFCLIDTDCNATKDSKIQEAVLEARRDKEIPISILTSNPCFEIWFILHDRYTEKQYNSSVEVLDDLRRIKGWENYEKSDTDTFGKSIVRVDKAIANAKRLERKHISDGLRPQTVAFMPSTEVYRLVSLLLGLNEK